MAKPRWQVLQQMPLAGALEILVTDGEGSAPFVAPDGRALTAALVIPDGDATMVAALREREVELSALSVLPQGTAMLLPRPAIG